MQEWVNFFHDIQQKVEDLADVVAALQSGDRVVNIHFNVCLIKQTMLSNLLGRHIFFDQLGMLIRKFKIQAVPAII